MKIIKYSGIAVAMTALCFACGGSGGKFEAAVEKFCASRIDGDKAAAMFLLLEYAKKTQLPPESVAERGAVYRLENSTVRFFRPKPLSLTRKKDFQFLAADTLSGSVAFAYKRELALFDGSGDSIFFGSLPGEADVMALAFSKGGQYILQGNRLLHRSNDGTVAQVLDTPVVGSLPSQATHRALMLKSDDFVAVNCGHAGVYSLSVVDVKQKKLLCKDLPNASFRFGLWSESLFYIVGASGNWSLIRMKFAGRETKMVCRFSVLEDIAFANEYICVFERGKAQIGRMEFEKFYDFPEGYDLIGAAGNDVLMKYNNRAYLLDAAVVYKGMQKIESCK